MKAKDETENDLKIVQLKKKQRIAKVVQKKINPTTVEYQFID